MVACFSTLLAAKLSSKRSPHSSRSFSSFSFSRLALSSSLSARLACSARRWAYLAAASGLAPLRPHPSSLPSLLKVESEQVLEEECGLALVFFSEHKVTGWSGHAGCSWVAHTLPLIPAGSVLCEREKRRRDPACAGFCVRRSAAQEEGAQEEAEDAGLEGKEERGRKDCDDFGRRTRVVSNLPENS